MNYINSENHCIIGDFNINIMKKWQRFDNTHDMTPSQDVFNHLLENKYTPYFLGITRPEPENIYGG